MTNIEKLHLLCDKASKIDVEFGSYSENVDYHHINEDYFNIEYGRYAIQFNKEEIDKATFKDNMVTIRGITISFWGVFPILVE